MNFIRAAKLGILLSLACVIFAAVAISPKRLCFDGGKNYTFFCGTSSADCHEITVSGKDAKSVKLALLNVCGEATVYENASAEQIIKKLNAKVIAKEELCGSVNYYCKANLPYAVELYGTEINLHVSEKNGSVKVGSPIIFGGY
ncbi:MAG: hypothetical protein K2L67_03120 [Clostridia bacterium]|nr:hypothetical protein [Clostridia bacterium]